MHLFPLSLYLFPLFPVWFYSVLAHFHLNIPPLLLLHHSSLLFQINFNCWSNYLNLCIRLRGLSELFFLHSVHVFPAFPVCFDFFGFNLTCLFNLHFFLLPSLWYLCYRLSGFDYCSLCCCNLVFRRWTFLPLCSAFGTIIKLLV